MPRSLTALITTCALLALAPAAQAADRNNFDLRTGTSVTKGHAHGWGHITFHSARRVTGEVSLNDVCPADGLGAYIDIYVYYRNGTQSVYEGWDQKKCGSTDVGDHFTFDGRGRRVIESVGVIVFEKDADMVKDGDPRRTTAFDNPYS